MANLRHISIKWITVVVSAFVLLIAPATLPGISGNAIAYGHGVYYASEQVSCAQPPQGVDLTTLSAEQEAMYGLPRRPSDPKEFAKWKEVLHHAKHHICAGTPTGRTNSQENFSNWAGYVATGYGYTQGYANYHVPCITNNPRPAALSQWVGTGGDPYDGGGNLVQTGTRSTVNSAGSISYYAWYEDNPSQNEMFLWNVGCSDYMYVDVNVNYGGSGKAYSFIEDYGNGKYFSTYYTSNQPNGSTVEWIVERPDNPPDTLPNFSSTEAEFYYTSATQRGSIYNVGHTTHNSAWMYNSSNTLLAHPGSISSDGSNFVVYYDHS